MHRPIDTKKWQTEKDWVNARAKTRREVWLQLQNWFQLVEALAGNNRWSEAAESLEAIAEKFRDVDGSPASNGRLHYPRCGHESDWTLSAKTVKTCGICPHVYRDETK